MAAPNEITVPQLLRLIGTPDCPVLVDISIDPDFEDHPFLIPGAFRHSHTDYAGLVSLLAGRRCIVICQQSGKLSQGLVARLRNDGHLAEYLQGGNFGWSDNSDAPCIPAAAIPEPVEGATLWVTRHRPKIDRIACPWLIRRFVDPGARFLFVSPEQVPGVADRYRSTPFDVDGVLWSHRGEKCTFDTMLDEFDLRTESTDRLSLVVRGAATVRHQIAPQVAGLLAISVVLSRQFRDDHDQLTAGMVLYDALYRWARDGHAEGHDWPADRQP